MMWSSKWRAKQATSLACTSRTLNLKRGATIAALTCDPSGRVAFVAHFDSDELAATNSFWFSSHRTPPARAPLTCAHVLVTLGCFDSHVVVGTR